MTTEPPTYEKNTKEQYEMLGRFVEAFEAMVDEVRTVCIDLISPDDRYARLAEIVFHHQNLTAKPLYEILRALIIQIVSQSIKSQKNREQGIADPPLLCNSDGQQVIFTEADRATFAGVMKAIADQYNDLSNKRNNLLHATWFIGFMYADDPLCSDFYVSKRTVTKDGLVSVELPKNAAELRRLSERCQITKSWIAWLHSAVAGDGPVTERFKFHADEWWLTTTPGVLTSLPYE